MPTCDKPTVLIVGAGLGGLFLGALLEKANVPYAIFERTAVAKPLGTLGRKNNGSPTPCTHTCGATVSHPLFMTVGPTLPPSFQQLGIYDDHVDIGKYMTHVEAFNESLQPYRPDDWRPLKN
ncbi:hypothetical protein EC957_010484, partial [Mortierella hygrophila]